MKITTKIDKKFLSFKDEEHYLLSTPITMMEDELLDITKDYLIAEKRDGKRILVICTEGREYRIREGFFQEVRTRIEGDYVLDCEDLAGEIGILDVLYANRDVTMYTLLDRMKCVEHLPYFKQKYFRLEEIRQTEDAIEGWILQPNSQDYTGDMLIYKVKRVPSVDIIMTLKECKKLGLRYNEQYEGMLVEYFISSGYVRERPDKLKPNDYSVMAREMSGDRVTRDILISFLVENGLIGEDTPRLEETIQEQVLEKDKKTLEIIDLTDEIKKKVDEEELQEVIKNVKAVKARNSFNRTNHEKRKNLKNVVQDKRKKKKQT